MEKLLEVKDLSISFKNHFGEVEALRSVSFNVYKSETLAIVGESACGKSVTANSIMGLLPKASTYIREGEILFNGVDLLKSTDREMEAIRGNQISMVFQDPMTSLNPTMKIGNQISEVLMKDKNISRAEANEKVIEILKLVSISQPLKRFHQYPHQFSGGMRQRVMIALAIISNPSLLIADEVTTALDVTVQAQILELMKKIQDKLAMAIILISHDLGVVADISHKILVMYAGQILEKGLTEEVFSNPKHPYSRGLLASIPKLDMSKNEILYSIEGNPPDLYNPPRGCAFFPRCEFAMKICQDHMPDFQKHSDSHQSSCWLNHPMAKNERGEV